MLITRGMGIETGTSPDPSGPTAYIQEPDLSSIEYGTLNLNSTSLLPQQVASVSSLVPSINTNISSDGLDASSVDIRPSMTGTVTD